MADRPKLKTPFDQPDSAESPTDALEGAPQKGRRFRFSTKTFFAMTFFLAFAAAGGGGMMREGEDHKFYVLFALATPCIALIAASIFRFFWRGGRRSSGKSQR